MGHASSNMINTCSVVRDNTLLSNANIRTDKEDEQAFFKDCECLEMVNRLAYEKFCHSNRPILAEYTLTGFRMTNNLFVAFIQLQAEDGKLDSSDIDKYQYVPTTNRFFPTTISSESRILCRALTSTRRGLSYFITSFYYSHKLVRLNFV